MKKLLVLSLFVSGLAGQQLTISPSNVSLTSGQSQSFQFTIPNGYGRNIMWSVSGPGAITYGVYSTMSVGNYTAPTVVLPNTTATLTATVSNGSKYISGYVTVNLIATPAPTPPPAPAPPPTPTPSPTGGNTITVNAGGDLQAAINSANLGDTIVLQAGATWTTSSTPFLLPAKTGIGTITIKSSATTIPANGIRIDPTYVASMPTIATNSGSVSALQWADSATHYRLTGINMTVTSRLYVNSLLMIGRNDATQLSQLPDNIEIDHCYIHGDPVSGGAHGVFINATNVNLHDNYITDWMSNWQDSQGVLVCNTPGPLTITNNYIKATGENLMAGACGAKIPGVVPSATVTGNYFPKDPAWKSTNWVVKNNFEIKNGKGWIVSGNVFEYQWAAGQMFMITLTPRADYIGADGVTPFGINENITFTNNILRTCYGAVSISGADNLVPLPRISYSKNVNVSNNLVTGCSYSIVQLYPNADTPGDISGLVIAHNTLQTDNSGAYNSKTVDVEGPTSGIVLTNNIFSASDYGLFGSGLSTGNLTITTNMPSATISGNLFTGSYQPSYSQALPGPNYFPADWTSIGFTNTAGGDYSLLSTSTYVGKATDSTDPGVNMPTIQQATAKSVAGK